MVYFAASHLCIYIVTWNMYQILMGLLPSLESNWKCKIKTNVKMCIFMYFKIQSDQSSIIQNALKSQIFYLFTKSSWGHK